MAGYTNIHIHATEAAAIGVETHFANEERDYTSITLKVRETVPNYSFCTTTTEVTIFVKDEAALRDLAARFSATLLAVANVS